MADYSSSRSWGLESDPGRTGIHNKYRYRTEEGEGSDLPDGLSTEKQTETGPGEARNGGAGNAYGRGQGEEDEIKNK